MRLGAFTCVVANVLFATGASALAAGTEPETAADRIARLIQQLGSDAFVKREAASKELEAIGAPALDALRKATSHGDPEIRQRARRILQVITGRIRAATAKKELAAWQGEWAGAEGQKMTIKGDQWVSSTPTFGPVSGRLKDIEVGEKMTLVDLVVEKGPTQGQTCKAIFRLDGDTLHYCGTYGATHPTDFKMEGNFYYLAWKRARPVAPAVGQPAKVLFHSATFSTDLPLPASKEVDHRVTLTGATRDR
jgi:uncharacterized protein (TIGR03067 family)